jgi:hypothetical protein
LVFQTFVAYHNEIHRGINTAITIITKVQDAIFWMMFPFFLSLFKELALLDQLKPWIIPQEIAFRYN